MNNSLESLSDEELLELEMIAKQERAKKDLFYLNKEILKHTETTRNTHGELCKILDEWRDKNAIYLLPRGTFKSSIITEGFVIQELLRDPNKTVMVYCETYTKALDYVRAIREHFEHHIIPVFGNIKDESYWREGGFRLGNRTILGKEASVTPSGIDKPATGTHFDIIICDDLIGETNSNTPEQLAKVKRRFQELHSILNPGGKIIVVGTIWDEDDLYCDLIREEGYDTKNWDDLLKIRKMEGKDWNVYIRTAKDGDKYFFPERLNEEALAKISRGQADDHHKKQFYNDPRAVSNQVFTQEMRDNAKQLWHDAEKDHTGVPRVLEKFIFVDPAVSVSNRADYTGIVILGRDAIDNWFVLDCMQVRLDTEELLETIIALRNQYLPRFVSLESKGFSKVIVQWLERRRKERGLYFKIREYDPGTKDSKEKRIDTLVPRFRMGKIGYGEHMVELDQQIRKHPSKSAKEHDDILDALAQATTMLGKPIVLPCSDEDKDFEIKRIF